LHRSRAAIRDLENDVFSSCWYSISVDRIADLRPRLNGTSSIGAAGVVAVLHVIPITFTAALMPLKSSIFGRVTNFENSACIFSVLFLVMVSRGGPLGAKAPTGHAARWVTPHWPSSCLHNAGELATLRKEEIQQRLQPGTRSQRIASQGARRPVA